MVESVFMHDNFSQTLHGNMLVATKTQIYAVGDNDSDGDV